MTEKEIEQHIIELEKKGLDEWSNGNPEGYTQHLAPEATYFDDIAAQNGLKGSTSILLLSMVKSLFILIN